MKDMLVRLLDLPEITETQASLEKSGIVIRHAIVPEKHLVLRWIEEHFSEYWVSEADTAFSRQPVSCIIAHRGNTILGFACYETTAKGFFGPTGVLESERGKGLGKVLLVKALEGLKEMGYVYGIIGGVGPESFYKKHVNAITIEGSEHNIYKNLLRLED